MSEVLAGNRSSTILCRNFSLKGIRHFGVCRLYIHETSHERFVPSDVDIRQQREQHRREKREEEEGIEDVRCYRLAEPKCSRNSVTFTSILHIVFCNMSVFRSNNQVEGAASQRTPRRNYAEVCRSLRRSSKNNDPSGDRDAITNMP